ncbi:hypothetical protein D2Q93_00270 [Alicyclobacillaceae bacterium I2511]|nr:hypothetical protein D2Q93_00270 [Alicyclobacillaceae bacterium I2511]
MAYYLLHAGQPSAVRLLRRVRRLHEYASNSLVTSSDTVIRWGQSKENDPSLGYILNPGAALARVRSRTAVGRLLQRFGIRFLPLDKSEDTSEVHIVRQYRFPIFNLQALACFRADHGPAWISRRIQRVQESFREVDFDSENVNTRAMWLALRSLHSLGLDHGLVSIGMTQKGVLYVLDVTVTPLLTGRLLELYTQAVEVLMDSGDENGATGLSQLQLGTDIELMLCNAQGKMVLASRYATRTGRVGCDDRSIQFDGKRLPLLEFRPDSSATPAGLLENLRETMLEGLELIPWPKIEWRAGSMPFRPFCTGGHIHISGIPFSSRLVRALDNYLGLLTMMVEDPLTARLRRPRYGFLGDIRFKQHGGFEYRTPASFVVNKEVTEAALTLAYVVARYHHDLPVFDLYEPGLQTAFYEGQSAILFPIAQRNMFFLRALPNYGQSREALEPLFDMIQQNQHWDEQMDVRKVWGLPVVKKRQTTRRSSRVEVRTLS